MIVDKKQTRITSFTITKTILVRYDISVLVNNLEKLKTDKFKKIFIPEFTYSVDGDELTIESEYIKGDYIDLRHMDILYDDLVMHRDTHSFHDYQFSNYIVRDDKIYAIDLDDYMEITYTDRMKDWLKIKAQEEEKLELIWKSL